MNRRLRGRVPFNVEELSALAKLFGIDVAQLVTVPTIANRNDRHAIRGAVDLIRVRLGTLGSARRALPPTPTPQMPNLRLIHGDAS